MRLRALSARAAVLAVAVALLGGGVSHAAPGSLDPSWSSDGRLAVNVGTLPVPLSIQDGAFDDDDRLVVAGTAAYSQVAVARYLPSGELDPAFGDGGITLVELAIQSVGGNAVAIDSAGRVVVAAQTSSYDPNTGETNSSPVVVRLLPDGTLDRAFGFEGVVRGSGNYGFYDVAVDDADRIVLAGGARDEFVVARLDPSGDWDLTFGGDQQAGHISVPVPGSFGATGLTLDADGRPVVTGYGTPHYVARLTPAGLPDPAFDGDGVADATELTNGGSSGVATDAQRRVLLLGLRPDEANGDLDTVVARLTPSGDPDDSFDDDGAAEVDFRAGGSEVAVDIAVDGANRPLIGATSGDNPAGATLSVQAARLTTLGALDGGFGDEGVATLEFTGNGSATGSVLDAAGRLTVIFGAYGEDGPGGAGIGRFTSGGDPLTTFSGDGLVTLEGRTRGVEYPRAVRVDGSNRVLALTSTTAETGEESEYEAVLERRTAAGGRDPAFGGGDGVIRVDRSDAADIALDGLGRILLLARSEGSGTLTLRRYTANGLVDDSFDDDGALDVEGWVGQSILSNARVTVDAGNRPIVVGVVGGSGASDFGVWRYTAGGAPDTSFDGDGRRVVNFGDHETASSVALDGQGRIVVGGCRGSIVFGDLALARLTPGGALDVSFSGDGKVTGDDLGPTFPCLGDMVVDGSNRIVATLPGLTSALVRVAANGTLDAGFGEAGLRVAPQDHNLGQGVALDGQGRILAAGAADPRFSSDVALARYGPDGAPDPAFDAGNDGAVRTEYGDSLEGAARVAVGPDGRIVIVGTTGTAYKINHDMTITRYVGDSGAGADRTLTTEVVGDGSLTGPGIACPGDCAQTFAMGDVALLTPVSGSGAAWTWTGATCPERDPCPVSVNADRTVRIDFGGGGGGTRTLTVGVSGTVGGGFVTGPGISCPDDCSETYPAGTGVDLTAVPNPGFVFAGWMGGCGETASCNVTMSEDRQLTAVFHEAGGGNTDADGDGVHDPDDACPDVAAPGTVDGCPVGGTRTLTVGIGGPAGGGVVTAPGISCPGDCDEAYTADTGVELLAVPNPGFEFAGWAGGCGPAPSCRITMSEDRQLTAMFKAAGGGETDADGDGVHDPDDACPDVAAPGTVNGCPVGTHRLTVGVSGPAGGGVVTGPGISCPDECDEAYPADTGVELTAAPNPGFVFAGWLGGCGEPASCSITMSGDRHLTAVFREAGGGNTDADGDGVPDPADMCPTQAAPGQADGCPAGPGDADGDGVPDPVDACPTVPAPGGGCPGGGGGPGPGPVDPGPVDPGPVGPGPFGPGPGTPPERTPEEVLAAATPDQVATAFGLPSARRCLSRRKFGIRLRSPRGVEIRRARVTLNGRRIKTRRAGGRVRATIDLRGFRKGRFTVKIRITTGTGKTLNGRRRYRTCAPKRRR